MYDLIITGAGAAGMTAAIYAARYRLKTLIISEDIGGVALEAHKIDNYPGYWNISGIDLMNKFKEHVNYLNVEVITDPVTKTKKTEYGFAVTTSNHVSYGGKALIIALGTKRRKLNIPGESEFSGKGVHYCATCDGPFYKDKNVAVIGGSDAAASAAALLGSYAKKVYIVYRKGQLRAEPAWIEEIERAENIEVIYNANLIEVKGEKFVTTAVLDTKKELEVDGVFIEIGSVPATAMFKDIGLKMDEAGYIHTDEGMRSNVPFVYAAGDINAKIGLRQIVTACAQGAIAAYSTFSDFKKQKK